MSVYAAEQPGDAQTAFRFGIRAIMLLGGLVVGARIALGLFNPEIDARAPGLPESVPASPVLVISVQGDDSQSPPGALWTLSQSHDGVIDLVGLPAPATAGSDSLAVVEAYIPAPVTGAVVLTRDDVIALFDVVGPIWLDGARRDGRGAVEFVESATGTERRYREAAALQAFIAHATLRAGGVSVSDLLLAANIDGATVATIQQWLDPLAPVRINAVHIRVMSG